MTFFKVKRTRLLQPLLVTALSLGLGLGLELGLGLDVANADPANVDPAPSIATFEHQQDPNAGVRPFPYVFTLDQQGPVVEYLQYRLAKLNYDIEATGVFDAQTQTALKAFQRAEGLEPTGWLGAYTLSALTRAEKAQPPSAEALAQGLGVFQKGQRGPAIKDLQVQLRAEGYAVAPSGVFGDYTEAALKAWQYALEVTPTGQWGKTTQERVVQREAEARAAAEALEAARTQALLGVNVGQGLYGDDGLDFKPKGQLALQTAARHTAEKYQSVGLCYQAVYESVTQVYGDFLRGHSAYMAADYLVADPRFEAVDVAPEALPHLPPGWIVVWGQSPLSPHGHISISLGQGLEASDHINQQLTHLRGYTNVQVFRPRS